MTPKFLNATAKIRANFAAANRLHHPYVVEQNGMTRLNLGEDHFHDMNSERRLWIEENCSAAVAYGHLPRGAGQEYRFASYYDAFDFKMRFGTRASPPP